MRNAYLEGEEATFPLFSTKLSVVGWPIVGTWYGGGKLHQCLE